MIRQLKLAIILVLTAIMPAMAQNYIPIHLAEIENGRVDYLPEQAVPGAWVDFSVQPTIGYEIDQVSVTMLKGTDVSPVACEKVNDQGQYGFYMPENCDEVVVHVSFKKKEYSVTISDGIANGTVELQGGSTYVFDDLVTLKVTPDYDYLFDAVLVTWVSDGTSVAVTEVSVEGNTHYLQFVMPRDNVTVGATFKPVSRYAINIVECDYGSITSNLATARVGDKVVLTPNNDPGAMLLNISVTARYPVTTSGGGVHAPVVGLKASPLSWYVQQVIIPTKNQDGTYEFTLPEAFDDILTPNYQDDTEFLVTATFKYIGAKAIWCEASKTVYLDYEINPQVDLQVGDPYEGQTIDAIWTGELVVPNDEEIPAWNYNYDDITKLVTKVVFQPGFADLRPTSCYRWFYNLNYLTTIEGLQYLNTSQVTNMYGMFESCPALRTLDLNTFDMTNVSNVGLMFSSSGLTTIYCDSTWDIENSAAMFSDAENLVGAVQYNQWNPRDGSMANPKTGYFTGKWSVSIDEMEHGAVLSDYEVAYTNQTVTLTVTPDEGYKLDLLTVTRTDNGETISITEGSTSNTFVFKMPPSPVVISAVFAEDADIPYVPHAVTLVVIGDGTVEVPESAYPNETVFVKVKPNRFSLSNDITVTGDETGKQIECTAVNGGYNFAMPAEPATVTVTINTPEESDAVMWCAENGTLYFATQPIDVLIDVLENDYWNGHKIKTMWTGNDVIDTGKPLSSGKTMAGWSDPYYGRDVERIVFDESFAAARPKSCYKWFYDFEKLDTIEGLEYLNTSEVTDMNSMFFGCNLLTSLDVNSFDVSKVTDSGWMFFSCDNLTTIYCNNTWNISYSPEMFYYCTQLVGAVPYVHSMMENTCEKANPLTGYFTALNDITITETPLATITCDAERAYTGTVVTVTVANVSQRANFRSFDVTGDVTGNDIPFTYTADNDVLTFTFVMPGEAVTVATDIIQSNFTLAEALRMPDGTALNLIAPLYVVAVTGTHAYVTDGEDHWARFDFDGNFDVRVGDNITYYNCVLSNRDTAPAFSRAEGGLVSISHDNVTTEIETVLLENEFEMPVPCEVVMFFGYYYGGELRGLNSGDKGQSLTLDTEYSGPLNFAEGERLSVVCAVELKEPWQDTAPAGMPRRARSSYEFDYQNLIGKVLSAESHGMPTGYATIHATDNADDAHWYTIDGRRLGGKPTAPGVYIHGNRKVIVE